MKHTQGNWTFEELGPERTADGCGYIRTDADNLEISHHGDMGRSREENLANGHMLAASKQMFEALEFIMAPQPYSATQQWRDNAKKGREMALAALTAAKGA